MDRAGSRAHGLGVLLLVVHLAVGCKSAADERREQEVAAALALQKRDAERRELERAAAVALQKREAEEQLRVRSNPASVLEVTDFRYYDKGFINDYRQVTEVTVLNKSKFALHKLSGDVEWMKGGVGVGSIPFSLKGSIPAGGTVKFSADAGTLSNGTLQTNAKNARMIFKSADIVE